MSDRKDLRFNARSGTQRARSRLRRPPLQSGEFVHLPACTRSLLPQAAEIIPCIFRIMVVCGRARRLALRRPGPGHHYRTCTGAPSAPLSCPRPSPEPDCCRSPRQAGSVQGRRSRSRSDAKRSGQVPAEVNTPTAGSGEDTRTSASMLAASNPISAALRRLVLIRGAGCPGPTIL